MWCLLDILHDMLMRVTMYDPFPSNLGIRMNSNWLDYTSILIIRCHLFPILNLSFVDPNSSAYTHCNKYWQLSWDRTLTVKFFTRYCLINRPLLCRIPKYQNFLQIEYPSYWHAAFGESYLSTISNNLCLNPCNFNCWHSPRSQLYPSKFCRFVITLTILCHTVTCLIPGKEAEWTTFNEVICWGNP